jgi:hypothetical protein
MQERPMSVTIFGILNIGFAAFGLLSLLLSTVFLSQMNTGANPVLKAMNDNPAYVTWTKISVPVGGIASVVLLAAGIGLLMLKNWARVVSIGYSIYAIVGGIIGGIVMFNVFESMLHQGAGGSPSVMIIGAMVGSLIGIVFALVYPILLIIFMTRPKIIAAFGPAQPVA